MALIIFPVQFLLDNPNYHSRLMENSLFGGMCGRFSVIEIHAPDSSLEIDYSSLFAANVREPVELNDDSFSGFEQYDGCDGIVFPSFMYDILKKYMMQRDNDQLLMDMIQGKTTGLGAILELIKSDMKSVWVTGDCLSGMKAIIDGDYSGIKSIAYHNPRYAIRSDDFNIEFLLKP